MSETFAKIKKQRIRLAWIRLAVICVTCALIAVGSVLLALKLAGIPLHAGWYVLIGFGAALLAGGVSAPLLFVSDKKLARELDREYALNERTQTALAFQKEQGVVIARQREDAEEKLQSLPRKKFSFAKVWQYALLCLLAPVLAITAFAIPSKAEAEPEDPSKKPFVVSEFQLIAVRELIQNVNDSQLTAPLKEGAAEELTVLYNGLPSAATVGEMEELVYTAIDGVDEVIRTSSTYRELSVCLGVVRETACVRALRRSVGLYESHDFPNYDDIQAYAVSSFDEMRSQINIELSAIYLEVGAEEEHFSEKLSKHAENIAAALLASEAEKEDRVRIALGGFADDLQEIVSDYDLDLTAFEEARGAVQGSIVQMASTLGVPLSEQAYALGFNKFVSQKLRDVFGLPPWEHDPKDDFDDAYEESGGSGDVDPNPGDDNPNPGGGYGTGDPVYGSNDLIYDPDSGKYVEYGVLMNRYYAILQEYFETGELTPEQEANARAYFDILFSGFKN